MYEYYHCRFWCYQKECKYFKKLNLAVNMSSTGLIAIGAIAGGLTLQPAILGSISGAGLALKTFSETKDYKRKTETSKFAYNCLLWYPIWMLFFDQYHSWHLWYDIFCGAQTSFLSYVYFHKSQRIRKQNIHRPQFLHTI